MNIYIGNEGETSLPWSQCAFKGLFRHPDLVRDDGSAPYGNHVSSSSQGLQPELSANDYYRLLHAIEDVRMTIGRHMLI